MIAVLSPAKTLTLDGPLSALTATSPRFAEEASTLARAAARLPQTRLRTLMGISPALAKLNHDRFVAFEQAAERPALFTFAGDVYRGFNVATLDEAGIAYAQDHLRLLSGLYGLLRPLDRIRPYRLEMGVHWAPRRKLLTDWWNDRVATALANDLAVEGSRLILNLASNEYWAAVNGRLPADVQVIAFDFREGPDRRFHSFHAKHARGAMARWVVEHRIAAADDLRGFDWEGYRHVADESTPERWRFVRGDAA